MWSTLRVACGAAATFVSAVSLATGAAASSSTSIRFRSSCSRIPRALSASSSFTSSFVACEWVSGSCWSRILYWKNPCSSCKGKAFLVLHRGLGSGLQGHGSVSSVDAIIRRVHARDLHSSPDWKAYNAHKGNADAVGKMGATPDLECRSESEDDFKEDVDDFNTKLTSGAAMEWAIPQLTNQSNSSPVSEPAVAHCPSLVYKAFKGGNLRGPITPRFHTGSWHQLRPRHIETEARQRGSLQPEDTDMYFPVKAFFVSRSVDLKSLANEQFDYVISSRKELVLRCKDRPHGSPANANKPGVPKLRCWTCERYMVVYNYGSVVLFNFGDDEEAECLNIVRKYCKDQFERPKKEDYGVLIRPTLSGWSEGSHDIILLRKLDIDNIRIIASVLAQSIALDYFAKMVDEMINTFSELNRGMEQTGTFTMTRKKLFQLVATANSTLADVIVRMGLLERSDAAWKNINYARIFEFMRDEFDLDERFESLYFKLNIIQHNVRLFLEVLQNRKSDTLEWIIIVLLAGEIGVGVYDILHDTGII